MRKICIHDNDKVSRAEFEAMNVGSAETKFTGSWLKLDMGGIGFCELKGHGLGTIGTSIVDDY